MMETVGITIVALAVVGIAFVLGRWYEHWVEVRSMLHCDVEIQQGQRKDGREGRWRWQARVNNGVVIACSGVRGHATRESAEVAANHAMRGWHTEIEVVENE